MLDNEDRADLGEEAVYAAAKQTNVHEQEDAATAITDVLAYIAHFCERVGLDPAETFRSGLDSYEGDFEDGPRAAKLYEWADVSLAEIVDGTAVRVAPACSSDEPCEQVETCPDCAEGLTPADEA